MGRISARYNKRGVEEKIKKKIMNSKIHLMDKVIQVLEKNLGIVTPTCKEVGISRDTFYDWLKRYPDFKKKVDAIDDIQLDFVENQLFKKIKEGSEKSIMFYMRYKGRKRGYKESMDIDASIRMEQDRKSVV